MIGEIHWQQPDTDSLTLSWQTLAAMATVSSIVVGAAVSVATAYLKSAWKVDLTAATVEITDRVRAEITRTVSPLERRVERIEDRQTPNPYRSDGI